MEKISVIIPVYNVEEYLEKCVQSVLNQTYKNLEIILVDDGATDSSGSICDELAKKDNRIKVIHKKNGGLSSARNEAMKIVTGELVAFVDSDDYIISDFYEYLYNLLKKHDADIAEAEFLRIPAEKMDEAEEILNEKNREREVEETVCNNIDALNILYGVKEDPYVKKVVVWNKLYKRDVLKNIIFPERKLHEDEFTTHKILYGINKIVSSNRYIHGYMQTKNSIMRAEISERRINDNLGASLAALDFFKDKNLANIKAKIMMRYLENCIELSGKVSKEESTNKFEKLNLIENRFLDFYKNMNYIEKHIENDLEKNVFDLLVMVHDQTIEKHNLCDFWNELMLIIK